MDNAVDAGTGTVTLKAEFPNDDGALWPGQFVDVDLVLTVEPAALTVPAAAVVTGQEGTFVFVVGADRRGREARREGEPHRRRTAPSWTGGLGAGETVVTDGQMRLVPGAVVEVKPAGPAQGGRR